MKTTTIILIVIGAVIISTISTAFVMKHSFHKKHLNHFNEIEKKLELSKEQSKEVKNLVLDYMPKALEIVLFEDDRYVVKSKIHELQNEAEKKLQEVLNPKQFEEFKKLKKKRCYNKRFHKRHCIN